MAVYKRGTRVKLCKGQIWLVLKLHAKELERNSHGGQASVWKRRMMRSQGGESIPKLGPAE